MLKLLIADDDSQIRDMLKFSLENENVEIIGEATCGKEVIDSFSDENIPDIVTLDIEMPGHLNGLDVLERLMVKYPQVKIIIISGRGEKRNHSIELGAYEFIEKPFYPSKLKNIINSIKNNMN